MTSLDVGEPRNSNDDRDETDAKLEPLPEGWVEEKVQVDRRKLEFMILLNANDERQNAEQFFHMVESQTNAKIQWPTRLKIGAKTKKDPFVKVIGPEENVRRARELILTALRVKKDRATLKIEIPHPGHSHIIGKKGRNTQLIMQTTQCHIHFPDSNKHSDAEKNNQVSIAGPMGQVELARTKLREIAPVLITASAVLPDPCLLADLDAHKKLLSQPDVFVTAQVSEEGQAKWAVKASASNHSGIVQTMTRIRELTGLKPSDLTYRLNFELRPALLSQTYGLFNLSTIRWIALQTNTYMQFSPQDSFVVVLGEPHNILQARLYLTGLLPISLQFEVGFEEGAAFDKGFIKRLETDLSLSIAEKRKAGNEVMFTIRTHEANLTNAYQARKVMMGEENEVVALDYDHMKDILNLTRLQNSTSLVSRPQLNFAQSMNNARTSAFQPCIRKTSPNMFSQSMNITTRQQQPSSPDPFESPIAHSLLAGMKSLNLQRDRRDPWMPPGFERRPSKENLKSNGMDESPSQEPNQSEVWNSSQHGFSASLPASLLRNDLNNSWDKSQRNAPDPAASPGPQRIHTPSQKALASVREEDELTDYNHSHSSNLSGSPFSRSHFFHQSAQQPVAFSQSTHAALLYDSAMAVDWDVHNFSDTAAVLQQLGMLEYLQQFGEQEIDLHAFLLLDEDNLKDIGVVKMGARKKIYHAITKLRESAERHGFRM